MSVEQAKLNHLLLINPVPPSKDRLSNSAVGRKIPPQGPYILEALTPSDWTTQVYDETEKPFNIGELAERPSVVGITCMTDQAPQAYRIANAFRQQGIPVILGGPHPTLRPYEALCHADSVFVGEADVLWPKVLDDVQNGNLQSIYQGGMVLPEQIPILCHPGRDKYKYGVIQTARGCPRNCEFCSVTTINGARIRYRTVADVVEELRNIKQKFVLVADDNFRGLGDHGLNRALELCEALVKDQRQTGIRKFWGTQATQDLGREDELLKWMYKAGCRVVLYGFESINPQVLIDVKKRTNKVEDFKKNIRNTQRHRIAVIGSFVFGFDSDDPDAFNATVRFIKDSGVAAQNLNLLCPFPGTRTFDKFLQSGNLRYTDFPTDWERYNLKDVVINPQNCSPLELCIRRRDAEYKLNNMLSLVKRTSRTLWETRSLYASVIALLWNRGSWRMRDYQDQIEQLKKEMAMAASNAV